MNFVEVGIGTQELVIGTFGEVMNFNIRELALDTADYWTGEDYVAHRAKADEEDFHEGVSDKKKRQHTKISAGA